MGYYKMKFNKHLRLPLALSVYCIGVAVCDGSFLNEMFFAFMIVVGGQIQDGGLGYEKNQIFASI